MKDWSRREFISRSLASAAAYPLLSAATGVAAEPKEPYVRKAMAWTELGEKRIRCDLCPRRCTVADLERGYCGVRENRDGVYCTLVYGRACALNVDPIEKKPLFHFMPGSKAFSVATAGCNFECKFCQNWNISQSRPEQIKSAFHPPERLVEAAGDAKCRAIAYTYSEPVIFYEYMYETARLARKSGVKSVMISNGYISKEPMKDLCRHLDAVKVDFKAFSDKFYREVCAGTLQPVLDTMALMKELKMHLELVVLLIPGLNESEKELKEMAKWIVKNLGPDVPLHFSRFSPAFRMTNYPQTPVKTLETAHDIAAAEGIKFVYIGNVPGHKYENTFCPKCAKTIIKRYGYFVDTDGIKDGKCTGCGTVIPGVW